MSEEQYQLAIAKERNKSLAEMWCRSHGIPTDFLVTNADGSVTFSLTFK